MSILDVPGARLYYETHGRGPLMVIAPGASGTGDSFRKVTEHLAEHYTVALYDRRGFSRSHLDGTQDYDRRLETDADDLRRLAWHLSTEPAVVFGASSGAIIALQLLIDHPGVVGTLVPFEPPAVRLLSDGQNWVDFFHTIYDLYQRSGIDPALEHFREKAFAASDRIAMTRAMQMHRDQAHANATYWFEHELRQYPATNLALHPLAAYTARILPAVGRESGGYPACEATMELGKRLDRPVTGLPGGHVGCMTQPAAFAAELVRALGARIT